MAISESIFDEAKWQLHPYQKGKMANVMLGILDFVPFHFYYPVLRFGGKGRKNKMFFFLMNSRVPAFKVHVYGSDFKY